MSQIQIPNLRHLRAFREVARFGGISAASEHVPMSQPAITQAIAKLEEALGLALFDRRADGMYVTEPGTLFLNRVERALKHLQTGAREASRIGRRQRSKGFGRFDRLMTAIQLRALSAVADAGNFSLAARTVGVSQPSLHRAARDLERLSGVDLFTRSREGIELTRAAQGLAKSVKLSIAELSQGYSELAEWRGLDSGRIVVGTMPLARTYVLPTAINRLVQELPGVQIGVIDGPYDDLLYGLRHGETDLLIGALRDPLPVDDVFQERLFDDPLAIVARTGHPLFRKKKLTIRELATYPWVTPREGTPTRSHFERLFREAGCPAPAGLIEASSLVLIRELLKGSDRLTIISAHQIRHEEQLNILAPLPLALPKTGRPIGLTVRKDWQPTATQRRFIELVRDAGREAQAVQRSPVA